MKLINILSLSVCFTVTLFANNSFAGSCSKSDIDHYLKSGFKHDQIVKLCATSVAQPTTNTVYRPPSATGVAAPVASASTQDVNQIYFETVIEADPVTLSADSLVFERKECVTYGLLDMTQTRDKACARTRTTIGLKGLQIIRAQKEIILIKKQELIVKGAITREFIDLGKNNKYQIAEIRKQLSTQPTKLNIPTKKGIDPKQIATKLKLYR
jgi:hypothetical protein